MDDSAKRKVRQVLIVNCASNDRGKRYAAIAILGDRQLFELFCRAVAVKDKRRK